MHLAITNLGSLPITTLKTKLSRQDPSQQQHKQQLILANCISCHADITFFFLQTDLIYIVFETVRWKKSIDLLPEPLQFSTLIELARRAEPFTMVKYHTLRHTAIPWWRRNVAKGHALATTNHQKEGTARGSREKTSLPKNSITSN